MIVNGKAYTDTKAKAEALNNHFKSVFTQEDVTNIYNIPNLGNLATAEDPILSMPKILINFSLEEIKKLLSDVHVDTSTARGPGGVPSFMLKHCVDEISCVLKVIFTRSLSTGVLPLGWQEANICPIFIKRRYNQTSSYRPISLTSICSKVMEHIIFHSIMTHLNANS